MTDWMKRMSRPAALLFVSAAAAALPAGLGLAATCALPHEEVAVNTRVLQTDLMVAALTCGERNRYNSFVKRFEGELIANGKALRGYFSRAYGGRGTAEVNRFVTRLANKASARSIALGTTAYCASATSLFSEVLVLEPKQLRAFLADRPAPISHGITSCAVEASKAPQ